MSCECLCGPCHLLLDYHDGGHKHDQLPRRYLTASCLPDGPQIRKDRGQRKQQATENRFPNLPPSDRHNDVKHVLERIVVFVYEKAREVIKPDFLCMLFLEQYVAKIFFSSLLVRCFLDPFINESMSFLLRQHIRYP